MAKPSSSARKAIPAASHRHAVLDILIIIWLLSIIPLLVEYTRAAPGFPDNPPTGNSHAIFIFASIFAGLQVAVAVVSASRSNSIVKLIIAICLSVVILFPEMVVFLLLLLLYPLAIPAIATTAIILITRLVKQNKTVK